MKRFKQGINDAPQNCPKYVYFSCKFHTFSVTVGNKIWHIYFQFTTPARKLTHNTKFECFLDAERHEFWEHHNSSSPWARESPKSDPKRHEFWEHHNSSSPWARESPKSNPERHEFWERHNSSSPWARELPKSNPERHDFEKLHSLTPAKMPTNKESIHFSRNSHHNSNALINPIHTNQPITFGNT